jgi:hypothetical protein
VPASTSASCGPSATAGRSSTQRCSRRAGPTSSGSSLAKTRSDPFSLPVGLALDGDDGPILWVAQEGLGRVDGFLVRDDGGIENVPSTSTPPVQRPTGGEVDTFPDDVVVVPLP